MRDAWENGNFSAAFDTEMIVKNAGATGRCEVMREIVNLEADDLFGDE